MYFLTKDWHPLEQAFVEDCRLAGLDVAVLGRDDAIFDLYFKDDDTKTPLSLVDLPLPDYWEINPSGDILDGDQLRGRVVIYGDFPMALCWVDWYNRSQKVIARDRYDLAGKRYVQEIFLGEELSQSIYYDKDGQECLYLFHQHDRAIQIDEYGQEYGFAEIAEAEEAYRQLLLKEEESFLLADRNLLSTSPSDLASRALLYLHEELEEQQLQPVLEQSQGVLTRRLAYKERFADQDKLHYLPDLLGGKKPFRPEVLILTHTQDLEQIETLIQGLPDFTFHIGAVTVMGEGLTRLSGYDQVHLYPCIAREQLETLLSNCSVYLDIAYSVELLDANRLALRNGLLLYAFEETCHQPQLYPAEHLYPKEAVQDMIQALQGLQDPEEANLAYQRAAWPETVVTPQAFQETLLSLAKSSSK